MTATALHRVLPVMASMVVLGSAGVAQGAAPGPSFDCRKVPAQSIAAQVCADPALVQLDRRLAEVYAAARPVAARMKPPPPLVAEQRGWVKGRDDCWKAADQRICIEGE